MDADASVPHPPDDSPLDPDLRDLLAVASSFTHALNESGAFDNVSERQAERVEAAMALIERGDPASRRIAYLQLLDLLLAEPERFRDALTALHDQLAAAQLPAPPNTPAAPPPAALDVLVVSPRVSRAVDQLGSSPVTRWLDGHLYVGASADHLYRVVTIDYDQRHERAFLTTTEQEQWMLLLSELATSQAA